MRSPPSSSDTLELAQTALAQGKAISIRSPNYTFTGEPGHAHLH
ncbi:MAG: hypothetical protein RIQ56_529, partial [Candidatus Parcubacteria bacterium]